ncbi:MAG: heat-inducible transcriptional repressor HrcA [Proteobacteria bacterium]|nr:heat-inducible transcriptional repressor HrcA [Pseudomonadota bacterium]
MEVLTERERTVLVLIIESYINTAEPIGSKTISKAKSIMGRWGSATVRNTMADLEKMGLLYKPHAVAGRIPTHKAFRYYLDSLNIPVYPGKKALYTIDAMLRSRYPYVEGIMGDASKALAALSKHTGIVVEPSVNMMLFKEIEFVKLTNNTVLTVFVTSSGMVHTRLVETDEMLDADTLNNMKKYMNGKFSGIPFYALKDGILEDMEKDKTIFCQLLQKVNDTLETIVDCEDKREVYLEGVSKIIGVPEFLDMDKLKELFRALERKEKLLHLLDKCMKEEGIHVIMGGESDIKEMRDMSIITSTYKIGEKSYGILGVIGPVRMNYSKIIPIVDYTAKTVTNILKIM